MYLILHLLTVLSQPLHPATNAVVFENKYLQDCLVLDATDVGITYYCQVTITSADKQTVNVATANIGPIVSN